MLTWFQNPVSRSSVHALVDRKGGIHLLVDADRCAWSNDDLKNPRRDIAWLNDAIAKTWFCGGPMSLNDFTLSIEFVSAQRKAANEAQYRSIIELASYWRDRYGLKPNRGHLLRHSDINSVDRVYCPGPEFDLARIIEALGGSPVSLDS
jgi:N-acetyl-anhydromuramyl-L-alanine amidase AmpD